MLGTRIAALRRKAGLSQSELSRRLQISPSAVGMYEQGRREPAVEVLLAMAKIFDVSVDYLLTGTEQEDKEEAVSQTVTDAVIQAEEMFSRRGRRPFSRQELAVLLAAMLIEG